jgi:hypothetical protein
MTHDEAVELLNVLFPGAEIIDDAELEAETLLRAWNATVRRAARNTSMTRKAVRPTSGADQRPKPCARAHRL